MADIITDSIEISSGVISSGLSIGMGGEASVLGGTVTDAAAFDGGYFWIEQDGYVSNVSLRDYGEVFVDGGRADNITLETGGQVDVYDGVMHTGTVLSGGVGIVYAAGSGLNIAVSDGGRFLVYGGYVADTVITSGGSFVIQTSGGLAADTIISSGGHARVVSGAQASRTTLTDGGRLDMLLGYMYDTVIQSGGRMEIMSGQAYNTDIQSGGSLAVSAAGEAHSAVVKGGLLNVLSGTLYDADVQAGSAILTDAASFRLKLNGGFVQALSGTYLTEGALNSGVLDLKSGAVLVGAELNGASLEAEAGAVVSRGILNVGMSVSSGVIFSRTQVNAGTLTVQVGAIVDGTTVSSGGVLSVLTGASVSSTTVNTGGRFELAGTADGVRLNGTSSYANGEYILGADGGLLHVSSGALATDVVVSCGTVNVDGGLVSGLTMDKGQIVIGSGGVVRGAVLKGFFGGYSFFDTYSDSGNDGISLGGYSGVPFLTGDGMTYLNVGGTGAAAGAVTVGDVIPIINFPDIILYPTTPIYIVGSTPSMGYLTVSSGGLLEDAEASAMQIAVSGGGVIRNLSAISNTWVTVSSGGTLTGRMSFVSGTTVTAMSGGIVDFDLSAQAPGNQVLLTGLSSVVGAPLYTITVSAGQAAGSYVLADGATGFTGTLTVRNTAWATLGTLTVGTLTEIGGLYYLAKAKKDVLSLTIWTEMPTILPDPETVFLNTAWSDLEDGASVTISGGGTATIGYDAFAEMDAANDAVADQGTIVITGCEAAIPGTIDRNVIVAAGASVTGGSVGANGILTLKSGSSARDVAVLSGGTFTVEAGATLTVTQPSSFNSSGTLTVDGVFNFDISGSTGNTSSLLGSVANVKGAPTFTLTVGDNQAAGAYKLVGTPDGYNAFVLTVVDRFGTELGTVGISYTQQEDGGYLENRTDAVIDGKRYSIQKETASSHIIFYSDINIIYGSGGYRLVISPETEKPYYVYVNSTWNGKTVGETISVLNPDTQLTDSATFGVDAFATLDEAVAAGDETGVITISGGTFAGTGAIAQRNVVLSSGSLENMAVMQTLTVSYGTVQNLTVADGGVVRVSGGTVRNLTVTAGGAFTASGGILSGGTFAAGSTVAFTSRSGWLCFDISETTPDGAAAYDGLTYVTGAANGRILLKDGQAKGVYVLGTNAAGFSPEFIIGVKNSRSTEWWTDAPITVGGSYRQYGTSYSIAETDGVLTLTIASYEMADTVYVNTAWKGLEFGETVTLRNGSTATFGVDAFATYYTACAATGDATVYLDGGTFTFSELNISRTRKTVALDGSLISGGTAGQSGGGTLVFTSSYNINLTLENGATADSISFDKGVLTVKGGARFLGESALGSQVTVEMFDGVQLDGSLTVNGKLFLRDVSELDGTLVVTGTLSGTAAFSEQMDVTVTGTLDFDISGMTAGGPALFRGLSFVKGAPSSYSITVSSSQQEGVYMLADGLSGFEGAVTLRTSDGSTLTNLMVGNGVLINGLYYTLRGLPSDGKYSLSLVIDRNVPSPLDYVYVNSSWSNMQFGDVIHVSSGTAVYGYDAFSNLPDALATLSGGKKGTVNISGGSFSLPDREYSCNIAVNGSTLSLRGNAAGFTGLITVAQLGVVEISGIAASAATITVDGTGTLKVSSADGYSVSVGTLTVDGWVEFNLTGATAGAPALFQDLSGILGTPHYAIRQEGKLDPGTYLVATGATGLDVVDLRLRDRTYTLSIGGGSIVSSGARYKAVLTDDGSLALEVEGSNAVYYNYDWNGYSTGWNVTTIDGTAVYGYDAFGQYSQAQAAVNSGGELIIEKGTAADITFRSDIDFSILKNGRLQADNCSCTLGSGRNLYVAGVFIANDLTVSSGASLLAESGSEIEVRGRAVFEENTSITVNGTFKFTLAGKNAGEAAIISGLSRIQGAPSYVLWMDRGQSRGTYVLGTEAGSFDGVITVTERDGSVIGTVSAGETLRIGKRTFTLAVDASDNLNFTISALPDSSVVYVDSAWNGLAEGAAVTTPDYTPAVYQYDAFSSLDGAFGEVASGGTVVAWGGTLSRSNGMGKADVLSVRGGEVVLNGFTLGDGKMLTVSSGGAVSGTITVAFGATLTVEAGGMLTAGQITIESGASVMLDGILNFRLTGINPEDGALFRGFSYVQGAPALSLTVDGREQGGTFTLISDYGQFDGVLSVRNADGTVIGTLSVDETLVVGSTKYTLTNDETGDLRITVVKPERINVNSDWAGLAVGTTVVLKTGHTAVIGYDAFADPAEAFGRISRTGTVVIEKADIDTIGEDPGCAGIIILGDVSVRLFRVGSGVTVTVGSGGRLFTSVKGKNGDYLESGALTVSAGGAVTVEAGGVLSVGGFDFQQGASIMVNGTLDLSFVRGYVTIRKGFALIRGDTTYTMTTNGARQGFGSYFISYDEEALFRTYTVLDENGEVLGPLSVSETVEFKDRTFKLYSFYNMGGELNVVFQSIKKTLPDVSAYVNPEWEGLEDGTAVLIEDGTNSITAVIGKDAFTTYEAAAEIVSGDKGRLYIVGNVVLTAPVSRGATILSGATLSCSGLVMDSVGFTVRAGGTLEDVVIVGGVTDGMDKRMVTLEGGTLRNFTIDSNGAGGGMTVTISGSGRFTGYMTFKGTISGYPPIIDFDLSLAVESRALAENLYYPLHSYFFTGPTAAIPSTFRIVLEDVPAGGTCTYKLATGASDFGSTTITVVNNAGASVGTISVGGSLRVGDVVYSLHLSDDLLWLKSVGPKTDFTAPTVTVSAGTETPTNLDVTITAVFADDVKLSAGYYRFGEDGEWILCDGTVTVSENTVVYFKAVDAAGNESEIVGCTVGNIDKVAPDAPANLRAEVADHTVTLSWDAATDDFSGVAGYEVKYWTGDREFTVNTTETSLVLEDVDVAEWNWSVQTLDAAGNASGVSDGEAFAVADPEPEPRRLFFTGDFDGDGKAAFAMVDGGAVTVFGPDGSALGVLPLDDGWTVAGAGDFDGDGKSDLLRVNADGLVIGDFSNGDGTFTPQVLNLKGNGWNILGVGDFDGDGADDVLVANPTGASDTVGLIGYWKGGTEWTLLNGYSPSWEMVSAGDFDGDGKCDMLWRNSFSDANGRVYNAYCTWITDPAAGDTDWRMVSVAAPDEWNFLCSGDFDGNGSADIAMINQEGVVGIWGVKDGWLDSWSILSAVDANAWTLAGVGDFNGDGTDDIAWRSNETGLAGCWQIENKELASWQTLASLA